MLHALSSRIPKHLAPRLALASLVVSLAAVDSVAGEEPYVCTGYNPEAGNWELVGAEILGSPELNCPRGYAFFSVDLPVGTPRPGSKVGIKGRCCRLPDGVLTDRHEYALERCPADTVATGTRAAKQVSPCPNEFGRCVAEWEATDQYLRCTKLDTSRYKLGPPSSGYAIGFNHPLGMEGRTAEPFTSRGHIPLALRYGIVRIGKYSLDQGGFVGFPWGSVLTGKLSKREIEFSAILIKGGSQDGAPLKTYPDCAFLSDPLDPYAVCNGTRTPPPPLSAEQYPNSLTFRKHQLRVLRMIEATLATIRRELSGITRNEDAIIRGDMSRWRLGTPLEVKATIEGIVLRSLYDVQTQICTIGGRVKSPEECRSATSESFQDTRIRLENVLASLSPENTVQQTQESLTEMQEIVREQEELFIAAHGMERFALAFVVPVEPSELAELKQFGHVPPEATIESIDSRSAAIAAALTPAR